MSEENEETVSIGTPKKLGFNAVLKKLPSRSPQPTPSPKKRIGSSDSPGGSCDSNGVDSFEFGEQAKSRAMRLDRHQLKELMEREDLDNLIIGSNSFSKENSIIIHTADVELKPLRAWRITFQELPRYVNRIEEIIPTKNDVEEKE